jgi:hypothetical protein
MNLVPFKMLPDSIRPGKQIVDVGRGFQGEQPMGFFARKLSSAQYAPPVFGNTLVIRSVN